MATGKWTAWHQAPNPQSTILPATNSGKAIGEKAIGLFLNPKQ